MTFETPSKMENDVACDGDASTVAPNPCTSASLSTWWSPPLEPDEELGASRMTEEGASFAAELPSLFSKFQAAPECSCGEDFELTMCPPDGGDSSKPLSWEAVVKVVIPMDVSPPSTPRKKAYCPYPSSPPPAPKMVTPVPELREALASNSAKQVREALLHDPDSARFPFWDHEMEPPLCFAVRHRCSAEIVRLLLQSGAEQEMTNLQEKTPADILMSIRAATQGNTGCFDIQLVAQMLGAGPASQASLQATPAKQNMITQSHHTVSNSWFGERPPPWSNLDQQFSPTFQIPRELLF